MYKIAASLIVLALFLTACAPAAPVSPTTTSILSETASPVSQTAVQPAATNTPEPTQTPTVEPSPAPTISLPVAIITPYPLPIIPITVDNVKNIRPYIRIGQPLSYDYLISGDTVYGTNINRNNYLIRDLLENSKSFTSDDCRYAFGKKPVCVPHTNWKPTSVFDEKGEAYQTHATPGKELSHDIVNSNGNVVVTVPSFGKGSNDFIIPIAISSDHRFVVYNTTRYSAWAVILWDSQTSKTLGIWPGFIDDFEYRGGKLAFHSNDASQIMVVLDMLSGKKLFQGSFKFGRYNPITISPDGHYFAVNPELINFRNAKYSGKREIKIYDFQKKDYLPQLLVPDTLRVLSFSYDSKILAAGFSDGTISFIDPVTLETKYSWKAGSSIIYCLNWSNDGSKLVTAGADDGAVIWGVP